MQDIHDFSLQGMSCAGCVRRVETALRDVDGVGDVTVNLATERARVTGGRVEDLTARLSKVGYPAREESFAFTVDGLSCASCVGRVEKALLQAKGVTFASVNLATGIATVRSVAGYQTVSSLVEVIADAGYDAASVSDDAEPQTEHRDQEIEQLKHRVIWAVILVAPVFLLEMGGHIFPSLHHWVHQIFGARLINIFQLILTVLVMIGPGRMFYRIGIPNLLHHRPDMNSLVAVGTLAAFFYSLCATLFPDLLPAGSAHVYYESVGVIIVLILSGRWMEARAKGKTGAAIRHLIELRPKTAHRLQNGEAVEVPVESLRVGDLVQLLPGERVAIDGCVVEGQSDVDESMITGEPLPVLRSKGAPLIGGTINGAGGLVYRVTTPQSETILAQIVSMVGDAQASKLPIQALVDRVTGLFVPVVLGLAALTIVIWLILGTPPALGVALVAGVSVLIIACPCAMGLATPTSIMVGTGRAAEQGILFRKGAALQAMQQSQVIAFDKTGTLTQSTPVVTEFELLADLGKRELLTWIGAVEAASEHPIARAIVTYARSDGDALPKARDFQATVGLGASAEVDGRLIRIGSLRFLQEAGIDASIADPFSQRLAEAGKTPIYAAVDGTVVALLAVSDPVKPEAAQAVAALKRQGLNVAMISGDTKPAAEAIARQVGIDTVIAGVLPKGKVEAIQSLKSRFGQITFVGDGINDAPALAAADIGVALGTGTDIAIESADVVLMSGDIGNVVKARAISAATMRNIRQNLFWAFAYNVLLIPVAAGVLVPFGGPMLSPMLAAGAMALSSVFVVSNALRLRRMPLEAEV